MDLQIIVGRSIYAEGHAPPLFFPLPRPTGSHIATDACGWGKRENTPQVLIFHYAWVLVINVRT